MLDRLDAWSARTARWHDALASLFLVIAVTVWFGHVLFGGQLYYTRDMYGYHYPMKKIVRDAMLSGELPLWSPYFGAGQPIAANPAWELFYPPQWLVLLPDFHSGMTLHIVVHFYLCALGLYFLTRSLGAGSIASLLGSIAFSLGGPMLSLIRTLPLLFSLAWAPLIFLFARRFFLTRSKRDFLLAVLCGGLQAIVAEPTTMAQTWLVVGFYVLYRLWHEAPAARGKQFQFLAIGTALLVAGSLIVAAAQVIPMFDFIPDSVRSQALEYKSMVASWSLAPSRPLEMFYPLLFQSLSNVSGAQWITELYPLGEPFVSSFYIGVAVAIFFIAGFVAWRRGAGLVLSLCVFFYIVAIGDHTPLLRFLYDIGIFKSMRFPEKFALAFALVAVIWGTLTADRLFKGDARVRRAVFYTTLGWFGLALLMLAVSYNAWALFWVMTFVRGAVVLAILYAIRRHPSPVWGVVIVAMTLFDIVHLRGTINLTTTRDYFTPPPITKQLAPEKDRYRIFHSAEWDWKYAMPHADIYFMNSMGRWWSLRNSLMPRNGAYWDYRYIIDTDYDQTYLTPTADFVLAYRLLRDSGRLGWETSLMAMSNAWYRGRFRTYASERQRTGERFEEMMPVDFVEAPERYPRYYFADQMEPAADTHEFARKLLNGSWSRRVAFVKDEAFKPSPGVVRSVRETWRTIRIDAEATGRAFLVLSVTPHKYWSARIDGTETKVRVVNVGYQGLEIGPGMHTIELVYANPLVIPSIVISILALIGIVAGVILLPRVPLPADVEPEPEPEQAPRRRRTRSRR
jgi:hypothetical protein